MFVGGKLRAVSTSRPRREFSTPKGVGVGTRVRRVRRLYPGSERTVNIGAPEGFNLVWKRGRERRFVFEIDNGRVFGIKSGVMPYVKWQGAHRLSLSMNTTFLPTPHTTWAAERRTLITEREGVLYAVPRRRPGGHRTDLTSQERAQSAAGWRRGSRG